MTDELWWNLDTFGTHLKLEHFFWRRLDLGTLPTSSEIDWHIQQYIHLLQETTWNNWCSKQLFFPSTPMKSQVDCRSVDRKHGQQTQAGIMSACAPRRVSSATRTPTSLTHTHHTPKLCSCAHLAQSISSKTSAVKGCRTGQKRLSLCIILHRCNVRKQEWSMIIYDSTMIYIGPQ